MLGVATRCGNESRLSKADRPVVGVGTDAGVLIDVVADEAFGCLAGVVGESKMELRSPNVLAAVFGPPRCTTLLAAFGG